MCGIFGIVRQNGEANKAKELVKDLIIGISRLEYRGYDSAGIAIISQGKTDILRERALGKVHDLESKIESNTAIKKGLNQLRVILTK
ncbi:MAG: hypothetical protein U0518_05150 [Candidatus Gracilibacteria bacterium]